MTAVKISDEQLRRQGRQNALEASKAKFEKSSVKGLTRNSHIRDVRERLDSSLKAKDITTEQYLEELGVIVAIADPSKLIDYANFMKIHESLDKIKAKIKEVKAPFKENYNVELTVAHNATKEELDFDAPKEKRARIVEKYFSAKNALSDAINAGKVTSDILLNTYEVIRDTFIVGEINKKVFKQEVNAISYHPDIQRNENVSELVKEFPYDMTRHIFEHAILPKFGAKKVVKAQDIREFEEAMDFMIEAEVNSSSPMDARSKKNAVKILAYTEAITPQAARLREECVEKYNDLLEPDGQKQKAFHKSKEVYDYSDMAGKYVEKGGEPPLPMNPGPDALSYQIVSMRAAFEHHVNAHTMSEEDALKLMKSVARTMYIDPEAQKNKKALLDSKLCQDLRMLDQDYVVAKANAAHPAPKK